MKYVQLLCHYTTHGGLKMSIMGKKCVHRANVAAEAHLNSGMVAHNFQPQDVHLALLQFIVIFTSRKSWVLPLLVT
jgi:hypothetical protein